MCCWGMAAQISDGPSGSFASWPVAPSRGGLGQKHGAVLGYWGGCSCSRGELGDKALSVLLCVSLKGPQSPAWEQSILLERMASFIAAGLKVFHGGGDWCFENGLVHGCVYSGWIYLHTHGQVCWLCPFSYPCWVVFSYPAVLQGLFIPPALLGRGCFQHNAAPCLEFNLSCFKK